MYLFIFDERTIKVSLHEPTLFDKQCVACDTLMIIRTHNGKFEELTFNGKKEMWQSLENAELCEDAKLGAYTA